MSESADDEDRAWTHSSSRAVQVDRCGPGCSIGIWLCAMWLPRPRPDCPCPGSWRRACVHVWRHGSCARAGQVPSTMSPCGHRRPSTHLWSPPPAPCDHTLHPVVTCGHTLWSHPVVTHTYLYSLRTCCAGLGPTDMLVRLTGRDGPRHQLMSCHA